MIREMTVSAIAAVLLFGVCAIGGESVVFNGNFENDGRMDSITPASAPQRWTDVNIPSDFAGWTHNDWSTYLPYGYSLTLCSKASPTIVEGQIASVAQLVYLDDVNRISFDLKLGTDYSYIAWDSEKRTAVLLVDDIEVWNSDELEPAPGDLYAVDINEDRILEFKDSNPHRLSLAIKADVTEPASWQYWAQWDFVRFDTHCEGFGYLWADLNTDCVVDFNDLVLLAANWLDCDPAYKYDLFEDADNIVNAKDFAVFADWWLTDSWQYQPADELLEYDLNNDGVVDFLDYAMLAKGWDSADYDGVFELAGGWLLKSWLYRLD